MPRKRPSMSSARSTIEFCFQHENEIRIAISEKRNDGGTSRTGGGGSGHCRVSDPTAQRALIHLSEIPSVVVSYDDGPRINGEKPTFVLHKPEKWLRAIALTKEHFSGNKQGDIIRMKYYEGASRDDICSHIGVSRAMYHIMLNDIIRMAEGIGVGLGVLPPRH